MNDVKLSDFQPPLIIDIGSDKVKYSQPVLNSFTISNTIRQEKNNKEKQMKEVAYVTEGIFDPKQEVNKKIANKFMTALKSGGNSNRKKKEEKKEEDSEDELEDGVTLKKSENNLNTLTQNPEMEMLNINPNSVFDYNKFMESFPSILGAIPMGENDNFSKISRLYNKQDFPQLLRIPEIKELTGKSLDFNFDFFNKSYDHKYYSYGWEPVYGGVMNENIQFWKNIVERIGELQFKKYNFLNNLYSETPLIFTQKALKFQDLKTQVKKIYEIAFEEYRAPYILICSEAMLNVFSQNLTSGLVVDLGESGTSITPVKNGFTQYHKSVVNPFFSGRNITALLAVYSKYLRNKSNESKDHSDLFKVSVNEYFSVKFLKESNPPFACYNHSFYINPDAIHHYKGLDYNVRDISSISYLYSFPEIYKWMLSARNYREQTCDLSTFYTHFKSIVNFITCPPKDEKKFNEREVFHQFSYSDFEKNNIHPYLNQMDSREKKLILKNLDFVNKEELNRFRQLSLSHFIFDRLEKLITEDTLNTSKYVNVVFGGGVLNTSNLPQVISNDFYSLLKYPIDDLKLHFKEGDKSISFCKGANYLSKIEDLGHLMVSKQDYYDFGSDYLCYNYI